MNDNEYFRVVEIFHQHLVNENHDTDYAFRAIRRWYHTAQRESKNNRDMDRIIELLTERME